MKKRLSPSNMLVAIDVGTTKICVLVAQKITADTCEIIGIGRAPSHGLARGVVVDVAAAVHAIKAAIEEAELMSGTSIESAYVGISGSHIAAHHSSGMIPIKQGVIRENDIQRVIATAQAIPLPEDEQILHAIPQQFIIDGKHQVLDPLNMHGVRLEAKVHIITGNVTQVKNLIECCEAAGVKVRDIILEPIASAEAVLSPDERELGTAILDIGGGTSDFAIYGRGAIKYTKIFPIAGNLFTNDLALCLHTTREEAERIKKLCGVDSEETWTIAGIDGNSQQEVSRQEASFILGARTDELLSAVKHEMDTGNLAAQMPAGIVLTGGGSLLHGLAPRAGELLGIPVRLGKPHTGTAFKEELSHPLYATGYGLLVHALKEEARLVKHDGSSPLISRVFWRMKSWITDLF